MINGQAEVRWELRQRKHESTCWTSTDEFPDESDARDAYEEAQRDRMIARAELVMVVEVVASTHSKSSPRA